MFQPVASTQQGELIGKRSKNIDGRPFCSFQGIPYAKPPLGDLRFKAPQLPGAWSGLRDATKEGNMCVSRDGSKNIVGSEDCLFLNVYTQNSFGPNRDLKPVMVWIHGGRFTSGSGNSQVYGPEYLMAEDIVLVTINYRLGILGFLHLDDGTLGVPGNAGLKDMVMALRWIQDNIRNFSGDPNNVTIFGESAGGVAVHYLILSPQAKGLFHKAIAQSGCALNASTPAIKNLGALVASELKMTDSTEGEILQRLKALSASQLLELSETVEEMWEKSPNVRARLAFGPIVEKTSPDAFITDEPVKIIRSGNYNHVPVIFSYNSEEGMFFELKNRPQKATMPKNFESLLPVAINLELGSEALKNIASKVQKFYYPDDGSEDDIDKFYKFHTDNFFVRDIWFATRFHAVNNKFPVYLCRMSIETKLNFFRQIYNVTTPGMCHGDDIGYFFKTRIAPPLKPGSLEMLAVRRFAKYWTNFARDGNPNVEEVDGPEWKPVEEDLVNYVNVGKDVSAGVDPEGERMEFWRDVYKINPLYVI